MQLYVDISSGSPHIVPCMSLVADKTLWSIAVPTAVVIMHTPHLTAQQAVMEAP